MNKKYLFLIIASVLLLFVVIILFFLETGKKSTSQKNPVIIFPSQNINYSNPSISSNNSLGNIPIPTSLPVYQTISIEYDKDKRAKQIASAFGIEDQYDGIQTQTKLRVSDNQNSYTWVDGDKLLLYNLNSGIFKYSSSFKENLDNKNDDKAKNTVISFLSTNNLLPNKYQITIEHLLLPSFTVIKGDNFSVYKILITPKTDELQVISNKNSGDAISVLLNKDFSFFKFNYTYTPLGKTTTLVKILNPKDVLSAVNNLQVKPSFINITSPHAETLPEDINITKLYIKTVELVYYYDPSNLTGFVYPVYKISADFEADSEMKGSVIYLVQSY